MLNGQMGNAPALGFIILFAGINVAAINTNNQISSIK
jgi:hypothetical protein